MESLLQGSFPRTPSPLSTGERIRRGHTFRKAELPNLSSLLSYGLQVRGSSSVDIFNKYSAEYHHNQPQRRPRLYLRSSRTFLVNAYLLPPLESQPGANYKTNSPWNSIKNAADTFYQFSRPHTVIGTVFSIISVSLLAVEKMSNLNPLFFTKLLQAVIAALLMNTYVVGLNQLTDIDIDKVNKPYLPLASGEYSVGTGVMIVTSSLIMSFWLGWVVGSWPLFVALFVHFVLGTAYSINLPLLRWKRSPVAAAMCILIVRALSNPTAYFLNMQIHVYERPVVFPRSLILATAVMTFFSIVIALFKDIPDIDGDKIFGIQSFTVRMGQKRVFWICISLLEMAYVVAILVGSISPCLWNKVITVLGHAVLATALWARAKSLDLKSKAAITSFYMFIWKLFYAEYLLIPFVR
ncbi:homogentisate phytyltransferase 1, chloroplastic-like isoform X2 [Punica granatum]|uniref:Homogentisate phytyltransferase 1, chloroplastic-like isoform X2 n=1 Tax=Punica granatum TaxID=22663 RepID=A0A6P8C3R1_PUNGR|nr:homogentisate phytyltransferase 1, chloroplastic-like isoform X2 [Punica granatum]